MKRNGSPSPFLLTHGRVTPSHVYRVDYVWRSEALSGDRGPSDARGAACKGVDVLIPEAIDLDLLRTLVPSRPTLKPAYAWPRGCAANAALTANHVDDRYNGVRLTSARTGTDGRRTVVGCRVYGRETCDRSTQ
jgi:hypothetical protein